MTVPKSVIRTDQELEGVNDRATAELAQHRWNWTLNELNDRRVTQTEYAKAVGRSQSVIGHYARGWALYRERMASSPATSSGFTIQDAIRLAGQSAEMQEFSEVIAEGSGRSVAQVARGDNRYETREIIAHAKERAERYGTDALDEARGIAERQVKTREMERRHRYERRTKHELRWMEAEGCLSKAKRLLLQVLEMAKDVPWNEEERGLLRDSLSNVEAVIKAVDQRLLGEGEVDWDAELAKLRGTD